MAEEKPLDIHAEREKWFEQGLERWNELTKDWEPKDRLWAQKFWTDVGMPWG